MIKISDFDKLHQELKSNPGAEKLFRSAAASEEGKRIMQSIDSAAVEKAARNGDAAALKAILSQVLSTPDGKALAQKMQQALGQK